MENYNKTSVMKLKLHLLQEGVKLNTRTINKLKNVIFNDYVTCSGLLLKLFGNNQKTKDLSSKYLNNREYVTAPINSKSRYSFVVQNNNFIIKYNNKIVCKDVGLCKPNNQQTECSYVAIHGDRIRISLVCGCVGDCKFCGLNKFPYSTPSTQSIKQKVDDIINKKGQVTRLFFTGGNPRESDFCNILKTIKELVQYYKQKGITNFDYMFSPRGTKSYFNGTNQQKEYLLLLTQLKQIGITTVAIDMEIYDKKLLSKYAPFKSKIGRENYLSILSQAVDVFGEGNVRSNIIIGLEPIKSSLKAVEQLAKIHVQPCLSAYEPYEGLPEVKKPSWKDLYEVYQKSLLICKKYNVRLAPSIFATDTHNSIASAKDIRITPIEKAMFYSNLKDLLK